MADEVKEVVEETTIDETNKEEIVDVEVTSEGVVEEAPKKGKKDKKAKKEKKAKEPKAKKKMSKKPIILLVILAIIVGGGYYLFNQLPTIMKGNDPTYPINVDVTYKKNLLFNKYDINVSFNGTSIGTVSQGNGTSTSSELAAGTYVITFTDANDNTNTTSAIINVENSANYSYTVKADWKGLKVTSESISAYEPVVEEGTEDTATTEASEEAPAEEEVKEETPAEEAAEQ